MQELRRYSTRATITPTRFVNEYHWGNFKGNPTEWIEKYFDVFFYLANWGMREFVLRLPWRSLDIKHCRLYCSGPSAEVRRKGEWIILEFHSENDEDGDWEEGAAQLSALIPLRADLARGDYRCLYLAWLLCVQAGEIDDGVEEPPVPAGLGTLTGALDAVAEVMRIDRDLIVVAAERSHDIDESVTRGEIESWIRSLPEAEKTRMLIDVALDGARTQTELLKRLRGARAPGQSRAGKRRTAAQLLAAAKQRADDRHRKEAEQAERERARRDKQARHAREHYLKNLAKREAEAWLKVDRLVATKQPKKYDEAVTLLSDLRDLARADKTNAFGSRILQMQTQHQGKPTFIRRLRIASLLEIA